MVEIGGLSIDEAGGLLDLAGKSVNVIDRSGQTLGRLKGLFQKSESAGDADIKMALADLTEQVADAKIANAELKIQLAQLEHALSAASELKADLARYELWTDEWRQAPFYRLKEEHRGSEPPHLLCPKCYVNGEKYMLMPSARDVECPNCGLVAGLQLKSLLEIAY